MSSEKSRKIHEYRGFKIENHPYKSEPRWFIYTLDMVRVEKVYPKGSLRECKEFIDCMLDGEQSE